MLLEAGKEKPLNEKSVSCFLLLPKILIILCFQVVTLRLNLTSTGMLNFTKSICQLELITPHLMQKWASGNSILNPLLHTGPLNTN